MRGKKTILKTLVAIFAGILFLFSLYYLWGYIQYNKLMNSTKEEDAFVYETDKSSLFITYESPIMSFGSGHKKMYLFSSHHLLLGICTFGEFPIRVKEVNENSRIIDLEIMETKIPSYSQNIDYVESWIQKNKNIGPYKISYTRLWENE